MSDFDNGIPFDPWSKHETEEWVAEQNARDKPNIVQLPNAYDIQSDRDPARHLVLHPSEFAVVDLEYLRVYPYLWWACEYPNRPTDEAMFIDEGHCPACRASARARGLPLPAGHLPPLPTGAPRFRDP
jgi:hypothetical protein